MKIWLAQRGNRYSSRNTLAFGYWSIHSLTVFLLFHDHKLHKITKAINSIPKLATMKSSPNAQTLLSHCNNHFLLSDDSLVACCMADTLEEYRNPDQVNGSGGVVLVLNGTLVSSQRYHTISASLVSLHCIYELRICNLLTCGRLARTFWVPKLAFLFSAKARGTLMTPKSISKMFNASPYALIPSNPPW
jgi:hypothetical protein